MPVPVNYEGLPRRKIVIIVDCYKSDYKAETCLARPCEECSCGTAIASLQPVRVEHVLDEKKITKILKVVKK